MERLKRMVTPFILRRRKQDVLKDLPDKLEKTVYVRMEAEQERIYRAMASRLMEQLKRQAMRRLSRSRYRFLRSLQGCGRFAARRIYAWKGIRAAPESLIHVWS